MPLLLFAFLGIVMLDQGLADYLHAKGEEGAMQNEELRQGMSDAARYRAFALAAVLAQKAQPFTGGLETRTWTQIRQMPSTPEHLRNVEMPPRWVVRGDSTGWVICAPMADASVMLLATNLPEDMKNVTKVTGSGQDYVVIGESDANKTTQYQTWCSSY